jgi:hypothetical protein
MKKNKKTYLLLIAVLAIWGLLGFKIFGAIQPNEPKEELALASEKYNPSILKKRDTFSITANYRDPFLGTIPKRNTTKRAKKTEAKKSELPKKNIRYSGLVSQNNTKNSIFFVSIDGHQHMMTRNEVIADVKLVSGNSESIKVKYNNRTETIVLTQ